MTHFGKLPLIECSGSPREMGRQYGEQARDSIHANREWWQTERRVAESDATLASSREFLCERIPDVYEELHGIAEGSGMPFDEMLIFNQRDAGTRGVGCTSMALVAPADGTLVAKNNDGSTGESGSFVVRRSRPTRGLPMVQVTYAGWLSGLDAMNAEGLANTHGSVGSKLPRPFPAVDIRLWVYVLLRQCTTTDEFLAGLSRIPLTGKGFNIANGHLSRHTCVVEAAVPALGIRSRREPFVFATNHYVTPELAEADQRTPGGKEISIYRLGYLKWVKATVPPQDTAALQAILRSHDPWGVCRHGGPHSSTTLWSMIAQCEPREVLVCGGHPCEGDFVPVGF